MVVPAGIAFSTFVDAFSPTAEPAALPSWNDDDLGTGPYSADHWFSAYCNVFLAREPSGMDPSPWNIPLRFECVGFLGRLAIPVSGGGTVHHPGERDFGLDVGAGRLQQIRQELRDAVEGNSGFESATAPLSAGEQRSGSFGNQHRQSRRAESFGIAGDDCFATVGLRCSRRNRIFEILNFVL
jgi:hypothetical protein